MKKILSITVVLALILCLSAAAFASGEASAASGEPSSGEPSGETVVPGTYTDGELTLVIADDMTFSMDTIGQNMEGEDFVLTVKGTVTADGVFTVTGVFDGELDLFELASEEQIAENLAAVEAVYAAATASGEALSVEDAFIEYIHEWLLAELEVNAQMTIEQVEDEFMPLVREMNFTDFPAEMLYSGMLEQGVPMTFEEFSAQYVPAAPAGGSTSEEAFVEYIHEWLLNELENNSQMTIEQVEDEFMPLVEQMNFTDFPAEMIYSGMLETGVPMTYEEFVAAGGVY